MKKPTFSIIIPLYNVEKYLEQCLQSILVQTFKDFELICVDDASTDRTLEIVEKFAKQDETLAKLLVDYDQIIKNTTNLRQGACRNLGINIAQGEYLCSFDSDDWLESNLLEKVYKAFKDNDVDSVWYKIWQYNDSTKEIDELSTCLVKNQKELDEGVFELLPKEIFNYVVFPWNKAYRTDFIKKNNIFWLPNVSYDDVYFYAHFYTLSKKAYMISDRLYYHRIRNDSIIGTQNKQLLRDKEMYKTLIEVYKLILQNNDFKDYKESVLELGLRYKLQIQRESYTPFVEFDYKNFLSEVRELENV